MSNKIINVGVIGTGVWRTGMSAIYPRLLAKLTTKSCVTMDPVTYKQRKGLLWQNYSKSV